MKKLIYNLIFICLFLGSFALNANSQDREITNKVTGSYQDVNNEVFKLFSNENIVKVKEKVAFSVDIRVPNPFQKGEVFSTWFFPAIVVNTGSEPDSYNLSVVDLPTGGQYKIYDDVNKNGRVDPEDTPTNVTPLMNPGTEYNIIISITDNTGLDLGKVVESKVIAVSKKKPTSSIDKDSLNTQIFVPVPPNLDKGEEEDQDDGPKDGPKLNVKKFVYPNKAVKVGEVLTYNIEVTNVGDIDAEAILLVDFLPSGVALTDDTSSQAVASRDGIIEYSQDGNVWGEFSPQSRVVRARWEKLNPNEKVTLYFQVLVNDSSDDGDLQNIAWVDYDVPEGADIKIKDSSTRIPSNVTVSKVNNDYKVEGTVYDKKTGLPKESVTVEVYDESGKKMGEFITGKTGRFSVPVDSKGDYKVIYLDKNGTVMGERTSSVIKPGANPVPIEISGRVLNSQTKEIIPNAKLEIIDSEGNVILELETDENGEYLILKDKNDNPLKSGTYVIRITEADGHVSFMKVNVTVNPGDVIVNLELLVDPFGIVYDIYGGKEVRISNASVTLAANCSDPENIVILDDLPDGTPQTNPYITKEDGFYQYFLSRDQLNFKDYCLFVDAEKYKSKKFPIRALPSRTMPDKFALEVTLENGEIKNIENIESIPFDVGLEPKITIELTKEANKNSIEIGDVVTYTVEAENKMRFDIDNVTIKDLLPFGFKYVGGTLKIDDKKYKDVKVVEGTNDVSIFNIGKLEPNKRLTFVYQTRSTIRTPGDAAINEAFLDAEVPNSELSLIDAKIKGFKVKKDVTNEVSGRNGNVITVGPVKATVFVRKGVFRKNGTIIGKVFIDNNDNGVPDKGDDGLENISLYSSNGLRILSDKFGKYSVPDIPYGDFSVHIDKSSLPDNVYTPKDAIRLVNATNNEIAKLSNNYITEKSAKSGRVIVSNHEPINIDLDNKYIYDYEISKDKFIDLSGRLDPEKDLNLKKGVNSLNIRVKDSDNKIIDTKKITLFYVPQIKKPIQEGWIGEDDILRRVYVPESGLAKANFRLVRLENIELELVGPSLMATFFYPSQFAVKDIPPITYPDIKNHWAEKIVQYESGLEIIHGYPDGLFKPGRKITRAEATKLVLVAMKSFDIQKGTTLGYILSEPSKVDINIYNSKDQIVKSLYKEVSKPKGVNLAFWDGRDDNGKLLTPDNYYAKVNATNSDGVTNTLSAKVEMIFAVPNYRPSGKADFPDIPNDHWAHAFIKVANNEKIVTGYPDNTFRPDHTIPRYEMAVIANKAIGLDIDKEQVELNFDDVNEIPEWSRKHVAAAYKNKLIPLFPDNKFRPNRSITRAEVAVFILQLINHQKLQAKINGNVLETQNGIIIEGNNIDLSKVKSFNLDLDIDQAKNIKIRLLDMENDLEVVEDSNYKVKGEVKRY